MKILPYDIKGHIFIEMNMEIDDNNRQISNIDEIIPNERHIASFFIKTE